MIGNPDEDHLYDIAQKAQRQLGREVNIRRVRPERWNSDTTSGFLQTVRSRPMVTLVGDGA